MSVGGMGGGAGSEMGGDMGGGMGGIDSERGQDFLAMKSRFLGDEELRR